MSAVSQPKSSYGYGQYKWHLAWTVDVPNKLAVHKSGAHFRFTPVSGTSFKPPLGGLCPSAAWHGSLVGGVVMADDPVAKRRCLEALQLFDDLAMLVCQDCPTEICFDNYYMVHDSLWKQAHPNVQGMLCLPCLEKRVGRRLVMGDFIDAVVNRGSHIAEFCGRAIGN